MAANQFMGMPYPLMQTSQGYLPTISGTTTLSADLYILLQSNFYERVMLPTYGTNFVSLVFEQDDTILVNTARQLIIRAINTWEPRATIQSINISTTFSQQLSNSQTPTPVYNGLYITITFVNPNNISTIETLVLNVPLNGSQPT